MKELKIIFGIAIALVVIMAMWIWGDAPLAHYGDKGYRLCVMAIRSDSDSSRSNATNELVDACGTKYLGIEVKSPQCRIVTGKQIGRAHV